MFFPHKWLGLCTGPSFYRDEQGFAIAPYLTSDADVDRRIKSASAAFGAPRDCVVANRDLGFQVKGRVYVALVLTILLYNSEIWCLREDLLRRLKTSHHT